jgi:ABC-2 type transport system permease protein/lipopolysaccharide transport system permease protein
MPILKEEESVAVIDRGELLEVFEQDGDGLVNLEGQGLTKAAQTMIQNAAPQSFPAYVITKIDELRFIKFAFVSFVVNNLRRRYQRSALGFAWSLLNPLLMMIVMTTIFSMLFHQDPKSYGIYIFTGLLPWQFINESVVGGCSAITGAEAFMKKVYVPKLFFPLVTCSTELVNTALALVSMIALGTVLGLKIGWSLVLLPAALLVTFAFIFGIVLALSISTVYFRDLTHLIKVILQSFFYFIPIVWKVESLPKQYVPYFEANPFTHFIGLFRTIVYDSQFPHLREWAITGAYACCTILIGLYILKRNEKDIIYRL